MSERMPQEKLDAAHRKLCRQIGAELIRCMSDTDTSVEMIAIRLGITASKVWEMLHAFIDGTATNLDWVSDLAFSMGAEFDMEFHPVPTTIGKAKE